MEWYGEVMSGVVGYCLVWWSAVRCCHVRCGEVWFMLTKVILMEGFGGVWFGMVRRGAVEFGNVWCGLFL